MTPDWKFIDKALSRRRAEHRLRILQPLEPASDGVTIQRDGRTLINFSSNDYLGLSKHPKLIERAATFGERYGTGSAASRLITGTYSIHHRLEQKLASIFGREAALVFNSGFQANSSIIGAITDRNSLILADKRSHNSLLQGSLLSRAAFQRFDHNDLTHLETLLKRAEAESYSRILIVSETIFSMDGDRCDLDGLVHLAERYGAMLFVDDAHAVGVWGPKGRGLACDHERVDLTLGTFGKALGAFGAFVTCSQQMRDYLVNFCPGFIYTTAPPPPVIGAIDAALDLVPELEETRDRYHRTLLNVKKALTEMGFNIGTFSSQIIPVIIGGEQKTVELSEFLEEQGILATAIRPPTVSEKGSRLRLTLTSGHTDEHIDHLLNTLRGWDGRNS